MKYIAVNNPRTSYFVGGAEMVSIEHAKNLAMLGNYVTFFTINPTTINKNYSQQYLSFKKEYENKIKFIEIIMDHRSHSLYNIEPGENRVRWDTEALYYERGLFVAVSKTNKVYDCMISYFNLDALVIPTDTIKRNIIYLCGIPKDKNRFRTSFLSMYDKIIAISEETKRYWKKYTEQNISVISTGVDTTRFQSAEKKDGSIVFIGRLIERKGCDVFINAVSELFKKNSLCDEKVLIIGDGPQKHKLIKLTHELGLDKSIQFMGIQDKPELLLAKASICVFPSKRGEGLQGAILESMSCGACVVASDTEVNKSLLEHGRGVVVDPDDGSCVAEALFDTVKNEVKLEKMGLNARNYVIDNYGWSDICKTLFKELER